MNRPSLFLLIILTFAVCFVNFSTKAEPPLATITCNDYWEKFHSFQNDQRGQEKFFKEMLDLWNFEIQEVKKKYPDLDQYLTNEIEKIPGAFIGQTYHACEMRPENMSKFLGLQLEKVIYYSGIKIKQREIAEQNGCHTTDGSDMRLFDAQAEGMLIPCTEEFSSANISIEEDKGEPKAFKICIERWGRKEVPLCQTIIPSKENACLSEFGICGKNSEGECGWAHTEKSQKCAEGGL